jgi:hypothetical protein
MVVMGIRKKKTIETFLREKRTRRELISRYYFTCGLKKKEKN